MKILSMVLTNFARIYSGMNKTRLELNLSEVSEEINLFVGDNGSGKTSTMRCLHPFAYNNAVGDSTSNSKLIIDGMDGKKEITIQNGRDIYYIQHIYTRKKDGTITVKSYIEKNGTELNDNGIALTFKSIVETELGITETYLTLLSVSDSVEGFVEYTSSNRKSYATKLFAELGIYNQYYKSLSNLTKAKKTLLNNIVLKMEKYKNINPEDAKKELVDIITNIKLFETRKEGLNQSIGGIYNQLNSYDKLTKVIHDYETKLGEMMSEFTQIQSQLTTNSHINDLKKTLENLLDEYNNKRNNANELKAKIQGLLDLKDSKSQALSSVQDTMNKLEVGDNESELHKLKASLTNQITEIGKLPKLDMDLTRDELVHASIYLDELVNICNRFAFEVNDESVIDIVYEKYKKNKSLTKTLRDKFNEIGNQIRNFSIINLSRLTDNIIGRDDGCDNKKCFYKTFYENYIKVINQSQEQTDAELRELKSKLSDVENYIRITTILDSIFKYIENNKKYFNLPVDIFNIDTFISQYFDNRTVYNKELMSNCIDIMEQQSLQETLQIKLDNVNTQLDNLSKSEALKKSLSRQIETLTKELIPINAELDTTLKKVREIESSFEYMKKNIDMMTADLDKLNKLESLRYDMDMIQDYLRENSDTINKINSLKEKLTTYQNQLVTINDNILSLDSRKQTLSNMINDMESLRNDEIQLREEYDEILEIRNATSPTTGIPVEFIEYYVKEEMIGKINILLDSVYHGSFRLLGGNNVIIDENEFTLPYKKGNTIVQDISNASDGERAILAIAFSLVLIELSLDKYNIMLLDEIDSKLDHRLRGKFINMIETYMDVINAEQIFIISHNNMFDSYPVNVILTSEVNMYENSNSTIKLYL